MLVISRKPQEKIQVGHDIIITIVYIGINNVKIGVEAPGDMKIYRVDNQKKEKNPTSAPTHLA